MELVLTLVFLIACGVFAAFSGWMGARPITPVKGPRLVPWRFLMVLAAAVAWLAGRHALSLAGLGPSDQ